MCTQIVRHRIECWSRIQGGRLAGLLLLLMLTLAAIPGIKMHGHEHATPQHAHLSGEELHPFDDADNSPTPEPSSESSAHLHEATTASPALAGIHAALPDVGFRDVTEDYLLVPLQPSTVPRPPYRPPII